MSICILVVSHFGFEGGTLVLTVPVPGHCLPFLRFTSWFLGIGAVCDGDFNLIFLLELFFSAIAMKKWMKTGKQFVDLLVIQSPITMGSSY